MNLSGKHVLVLGLGESGLASACWCARRGARVRVADTRETPPNLDELKRRVASADFSMADFNEHFDKSLLDGIDLVVLSPGLSGGLMIVTHARAAGIPVAGEIELFARGLRRLQPHVPLLAITGTNGKTTTTALTGHLLQATGKTVGVAGNISPAALQALMDFEDSGRLPDVWVLELSSFQLETTQTLDAAAATVLNISEDHLDRYINVEEYASVKARIFDSASDARGVQVLNRDDARVRAMQRNDRRIISFGLDAPAGIDDFGLRANRGELWLVQGEHFLLPVSALPISGLHNAANAMAALALCHALGYEAKKLLPALRSFSGLPHRVQKVAEINGVSWFDDSKGTNVGATVAALEGIGGQLSADKSDRKIVLIAGGQGKGQDFSPLRRAVGRHARAVVLIGRDAPLIERALIDVGVPLGHADSMDAAVTCAQGLARSGDAVLLSPACASFDMFRNYPHRGQVFVAAVRSLPC